jgi:hypothetical protein
MCQPGKVTGGMGRAAAARLGSAADAFSLDQSKCEALRLALCGSRLVILAGIVWAGR